MGAKQGLEVGWWWERRQRYGRRRGGLEQVAFDRRHGPGIGRTWATGHTSSGGASEAEGAASARAAATARGAARARAAARGRGRRRRRRRRRGRRREQRRRQGGRRWRRGQRLRRRGGSAATERRQRRSRRWRKRRTCRGINGRIGGDEQTARAQAVGGPPRSRRGAAHTFAIEWYYRGRKSDEGQTGGQEAAGRARDRRPCPAGPIERPRQRQQRACGDVWAERGCFSGWAQGARSLRAGIEGHASGGHTAESCLLPGRNGRGGEPSTAESPRARRRLARVAGAYHFPPSTHRSGP